MGGKIKGYLLVAGTLMGADNTFHFYVHMKGCERASTAHLPTIDTKSETSGRCDVRSFFTEAFGSECSMYRCEHD